MDGNIPWYQSAIIRQQVVLLIVSTLGLLGVTTEIDWDATVTVIFAAVAALIPIYTIVTRLFKPSPNLTATASAKEKELVARGVIKKEGGFASPALLVMLAISALSIGLLAGCPAGTNPMAKAETLEQKVYAGYGTVTIFSERGAAMLTDQTLSDKIRRPIALAITAVGPVANNLMDASLEVAAIKAEIQAGATKDEQLMIAVTNLNRYYLELQPLLDNLVRAVTAGLRCGSLSGAERLACEGGAA